MTLSDHDIASEVHALITHNLRIHFTIAELAERVGVNRDKLSKAFKQYYKLPITKYLIDYKMKIAADLLHSSELKIELIAKQVGYKDKSSFTNTFTKHYGMPPIKYRKQ